MKFAMFFLVLSSLSLADESEKGKRFEEAKQMVLGNIAQRAAALESHKSCVQAASKPEQLKACHESHKEAMKKLKEENKAEREGFREKMKEAREQRKSKKS